MANCTFTRSLRIHHAVLIQNMYLSTCGIVAAPPSVSYSLQYVSDRSPRKNSIRVHGLQTCCRLEMQSCSQLLHSSSDFS